MAWDDRKVLLLLGIAIAVIAIFLRLHGIGVQPPLSDEVGAALTAVNYMENGQLGPTMWYHPVLRNIILYWSLELFGNGSYALRGMSILAGVLSVPLTGLIVHRLTRDWTASLLAAFLLAVEQVHVTFSRQAIQESWTTFFFLLGVALFVIYIKKGMPLLLLVSGVAFGLGAASKFHALFPLFLCLCTALYLAWEERSIVKAAFASCSLILIPLGVYLLTFIPWFGRGYTFFDWVTMQKTLFAKMATHQGNPMDQTFDIAPWQWFLKPVGNADFVFHDGHPFVSVAFSNPFVWLLVIPATIYLARTILRKGGTAEESRGEIFVMLLFLWSYLPLALSTRPIWLLSSLATIPFAFMVVALAISKWVKGGKRRELLLAGYLAVVLVSSAALHPLSMGKGKDFRYLQPIVERFRPAFERAGGGISP